jgi:lipopolysaccharide exporter
MSEKSKGSINSQIAKGAAWMVGFKMADKAIGLISTIVLARMLNPDDFGLVAMSMILLSALNLLISFGFEVQLIQNPNAGRDQFDTAWTFTVIFSVICGLILVGLASPAAAFYRDPRLEAVVYALAFGFALDGFANIGTVAFRRDMQFDREFKFLLGKRMASVVVTIPLALYLQNYWALVIGQLTSTVLSVALSYYMSTYRPRFSMKAKLELFHTSKWLVLNNLFGFLHNRAAPFLLARLTGAQWVGVHSLAMEIATMPSDELVAPINRAAFPGYAKAAHDLPKLRDTFLKVIASIALVAIPCGVGVAVVADLFVPAVLGWKWLSAIPLIQILAVYGVIKALQTNIPYVYLALGQAKRSTIIGGVQVVIFLAVLYPSVVQWGMIGAAWASLGTAIVMIPVNQAMVAHCLGLSATRFGRELVRPLIASGLVAAAVLAVKSQLVLREVTLDYVLALLLCVAVGAVVYVIAIYALWRLWSRPDGAERHAFRQLEALLGRVGIRVSLVG